MTKRGFQYGVSAILLLMTAAFSAAQSAPPNPQAELQARMRAAAEAQQNGDAAVAPANRHLAAFVLMQLSELHRTEGEAAQAADLCVQALALEDNSADRYQCAVAFAIAGQVEQALKQTAILVERDSNNAAAWKLQGRLQMTARKFQEASDSLLKGLSLQPDAETAYALATALVNVHETEKAEVVFQQLQRAGVNPGRVHVMAGRAYEDANLPEDAEREYKQAIAIDPKSRGHYFLGLFYLSRNGWEPTPEARAEFTKEVEIDPDDFFGNYFLGYLASGDKDYATSDRYLKIAATAKPEWPEPFLYLGLNAYGRGDSQAAEDYLRKAIQLTGTAESRNNYQIRRAYFTLGRILIQGGHKEEGTQLVEKSKAMETKLVVDSRQQKALDQNAASADIAETSDRNNPLSAAAANLNGEQKSQIAAAEKALSAILGNAFNDLGTSEARQSDYATALTHFQDARRWNPEIVGLQRNIALAAFLSGDYEESARDLRLLVQRDASDRRSQSMLAMSLYMLKQYPEAAKAFGQAPDEALADPRMTFAWADTLVQTRDTEHANQLLGKLIDEPLPSQLLVRVGKLYGDLGDRSNAEKCFQKAKAQDPAIQTPR
jgi:tetratricopeptide (TPR) repeat protein